MHLYYNVNFLFVSLLPAVFLTLKITLATLTVGRTSCAITLLISSNNYLHKHKGDFISSIYNSATYLGPSHTDASVKDAKSLKRIIK